MPEEPHQNTVKMFPVRERLIPNLGTFHSQLGNNVFPSWE